jgi:hypothetical protein
VAAAITIASLHFYRRSKDRSAVLQATAQIQRLVRASEEWEAAQRLPDLSSQSENLITQWVEAGLLEADDSNNPWGGGVSVTGDSDGRVVVRLESIPESSCQILISHFKTSASANDFTCSGKGEGETWEGRF